MVDGGRAEIKKGLGWMFQPVRSDYGERKPISLLCRTSQGVETSSNRSLSE